MAQTIAVVIGLVVGIAFIILFGTMFQVRHNIAIVHIRENITSHFFYFEPRVAVLLSGVNDTVKWVNESNILAILAADNDRTNPAFYNATKDFVTIMPHRSYECTFTGLGEIGYHGRPSERGSVIILHALPVK